MKIAYITLHWPRTASSSIGKKIIRQTEAWRALGHSVKFFSHLHTVKNEEELIESERFFYPNDMGPLKRESGRIAAAGKLIRAVRDYTPDIIYLRWGMYTAPMRRVFSIAPVVVEINTNDRTEHKHLGLGYDLYNRLTRPIFLRGAKGMVFTSNELTLDSAFTPHMKQFSVVTNGIDLQGVPFYPAPANTPPRLIFLGTPGMAWHGLKKLAVLADLNPDIRIDVIGSDPDAVGGLLPANIHFHGYLQGQAFEEMLANADAAIGTISLHLNEMNEASPFKTRDCAARGIPCILPYTDTDLSGLTCDQILQIPNTPDNLQSHSQLIHDFIFAMRGQRLARDVIAHRIDITGKERERVAFFEQVLAQVTD